MTAWRHRKACLEYSPCFRCKMGFGDRIIADREGYIGIWIFTFFLRRSDTAHVRCPPALSLDIARLDGSSFNFEPFFNTYSVAFKQSSKGIGCGYSGDCL